MKEGGKRTWYFADGYLPEKIKNGPMEPHEALMLFNTSAEEAKVVIDIYYSDRPPQKNITVAVPGERIISLRMDDPADMGGNVIPLLTQYAVRVSSSIPIVCQFGRLDTTQNAMSYYVGIGYAE